MSVSPPSTTIEEPVAYDDFSEARKATQAAISRAWPGRPSGKFGRSMVVGSSSSAPVMGVEISPGPTALTKMPYSASSIAMTLVKRPRPLFEEQYAEAPVRGTCSWTEGMLMILPPFPASTILRAARWAQRNAPERFVPMIPNPAEGFLENHAV